jgi:hypothetical protein
LLFSYGTLQQKDVQQATFGRLLDGRVVVTPASGKTAWVYVYTPSSSPRA